MKNDSESKTDPPVLALPHVGLCAVTLMPNNPADGGICQPGVPYPLVPYRNGIPVTPFSLVEDQKLIAFVTHSDDNDWFINMRSISLGIDPIDTMMSSDLPFSIFHTVAGLHLLAEIRRRRITEQVNFNATATLRGLPARMKHGLTLLFSEANGRFWSQKRRYLEDARDHTIAEDVVLDIVPYQTVVVRHEAPLRGLEGLANLRAAAERHGFASARDLVDAIDSDPDLSAALAAGDGISADAQKVARYAAVLRAVNAKSQAMKCLIDALGLVELEDQS